MIRVIARKEFRDMVRDGRFRVLAGLVLLIAGLALAAGWRQHAEVEAQHTRAQAATRAQWLEQGKKNPHSAAHYGVYAFKPKTALSLVDTGVDPYVGVAAWLEAHKQNEFKYRPAQDRTAVQRFGELTAAQALLVLMPLFIVLVTFGAFTAEREHGTLRGVLSLGVRARDLAIGKALGAGAALGLVLLPGAAAAVIGLLLATGAADLRADLARAILLAALFLAYFAIFFALSLAVSARARSSRTALLVLVTFWFVNSLVVSRVASEVGAALHPAPSSVAFQRAMQADLDDQRVVRERLEARRRELLERHHATSMAEVPVNFRGISLQEGERHGNEVFDRHYGRLFETFARQEAAASWAGLVSPMIPVRALSMALAGTDFTHHRTFVDAAEGYRRRIQEVLNADIAMNSRDGAVYEAGDALWASIPAFEYAAPPVSQLLRAHAWNVAILLAWLALATVFVLRSSAVIRVD